MTIIVFSFGFGFGLASLCHTVDNVCHLPIKTSDQNTLSGLVTCWRTLSLLRSPLVQSVFILGYSCFC